jgi:hypothetical protein
MNKKIKILIFSIITIIFVVGIVRYSPFIIQKIIAATNPNIDIINKWAWNDVIGWIDFNPDNGGNRGVEITDTELKGLASSSVGYIVLDCADSPSPPAGCSTTFSDWKVLRDTSGILSGWAWNDAIGWISFDSGKSGSPFPYWVTVDNFTGEFSGWAWNDIVGWISFNCNNSNIGNTCKADWGGTGNSDYKVNTAWRPVGGGAVSTGTLISSIFDTQVLGGVILNTITWKGNLNGGTVKFQIASSNNSGGPWAYLGPDGTDMTYYEPAPGAAAQINFIYHNNLRYFRYKIFLDSNGSGQSPKVNDVIINYSP